MTSAVSHNAVPSATAWPSAETLNAALQSASPAEVIAAKHRIQMHGITVDGSFASWQRLTTRLVLHGPVTKFVPESLLQTLRTDVWVTESIAADVEPRWDKGY